MTEYYRQVSFKRPKLGTVNFMVAPSSTLNEDSSFEALNYYCDVAALQASAHNVRFCGGRGQTMLFTLDDAKLYGGEKHDCQLCLRFYRRGGLIGKIIKFGFWRFSKNAHRARDEFALTAQLYAEGFAVPRPLLGRETVTSFFVTNALLMEQIPHTHNVAEILEERALTVDEVMVVAQLLVRFFQAEVYHCDLNIRNILLSTTGQLRGYLIDFDKCSRGKLTQAMVDEMLARLERSFNKEKELKAYERARLNVEEVMALIRAQVKAEVTGLPQGAAKARTLQLAALHAKLSAFLVRRKH